MLLANFCHAYGKVLPTRWQSLANKVAKTCQLVGKKSKIQFNDFRSLSALHNNNTNNTLNMFDRSYLKLRYVEMYYYLPEALLEKAGFISNVKLYVRGTDLFTADHLDKADAAAYGTTQPLTRSLQLGAAVTF